MIKVREITPVDFEETGDVIKASLIDSFKPLYPERLIKEFCDKYDLEKFKQKAKDVEFFVAEDKMSGDIVGVIGIKDNQLRTYFVHPSHQGKGIGRLLYDHFESIAKKRKLEKIVLEGSPLGEPIYKHFGFKKIKTITKERCGIPYTDAVMEKVLKP